MSGPVIGRDEQLEALRAFLSGPHDGPAALLLEGEAGIGKTTLWEAALVEAGESHARVLRAHPAEAETRLSFTGLGDLLGDHLGAALPELPAPQRRALEVALLLEPGDARVPEHRAVAAGCLNTLRTLARDGPLMVAVDDVQWLDAPSATALAFALRRLRGEPVRFLIAQRVEPGVGPALGLDRPPVELSLQRVRVGGLSLAALQRLLRTRLDVSFTRPLLRRVHETSGGNPFFALELARALERLEPPEPGAPLPVPDELGLLVRRRLGGLPQDTSDVLLTAALMGDPSLGRLQAAVGPDAASALRPALDARVARLLGDRLRFEHPLLSSVLVENADPGVRRTLHRRLAELTEEPEEQARHLALAAEGPDEPVAAALARAAQSVARRGAQEAAAALAEQARRLTPPELTAERALRTVDAGWHAWQAGDGRRALELLREGAESSPRGPARAWALNRLARLELWIGDRRQMPGLVDAALAEAGDDPVLIAVLHEILAWGLLVMREDVPRAARTARTAVELAEQLDDPVQLSDALSVLAQSEFVLGGGLPSAAMERALTLDWEDLSERAMRRPEMHWSLMLQCADRLDDARANLEAVRRRALESGDESPLPWILMRLALVELQAGNWRLALSHAEDGHVEALQTGQEAQTGVLLCARALIASHLGNEEEARALAGEGLSRTEPGGHGIGTRLGRWALGHLELALGRPAEAERVLGRMWRDSQAAGIVEPGENRYLGDLVEALIALGRLDEGAEPAAELELRGRELGRPAVLAVAARCRGLLAAARGERAGALEELEAALALHDQVTLPFERARTLLALGALQRAARRRRDARVSLEQAREAFAGLGAALWEQRAEQELRRIGGRAPSAGALTLSEQRVAELVATGRTNREVAATLVLAERTVESHLSHIYRKLGVRSRAELAHRLKVQ